MYKNLGYGIGNTIIACVLLPAIPAPFVVFKRESDEPRRTATSSSEPRPPERVPR
jgi:hypothetical protein